MLVLKFGGTSVGSAESIRQVKEIVLDRSKHDQVIVVVSAVGGITNKLERAIELAVTGNEKYEEVVKEIERQHLLMTKELLPVKIQSGVLGAIKMILNELEDVLKGVFLLKEVTAKSRDFVWSFGERLSSLIIYNFINADTKDVYLIDPLQVITCDESFGEGKVDMRVSSYKAQELISSLGRISISPGFIASTEKGELITLGRGGSDFSAALFANFYKVDTLEIWTDVSGLMTADPRLVSDATVISHLSYEEALELSHFGAKVIYPPSIQPALEKNITIKIKNTFRPADEGTTVTRSWEDANTIRGISSIRDISLLNLSGSGMVGIPNFSSRLFGALSEEKVNVIMITQASSEHTICVGIESHSVNRAVVAINRAFEYEIKLHKVNQVEVEDNMAIVALVGSNMKNQVGISGQMFNTLGKNGVSIKAIAQGSSERNITIVIDQNDLKKGISCLHESFFTEEIKTMNLFMIGVGNVGSALLSQIQKQNKYLKERYHIELRVAAMANSKKMYLDADGVTLDKWTTLLHQGTAYTPNEFLSQMFELNMRNSIFLDVTGSYDIADLYPEILKKSISVVTPNKIAATSPFQHYKTLNHLSRKYRANFLFETNVCAGLPVISTLNDLMKSGDRVHKIEAVLSGTLNYIFNHYDGKVLFSQIVKQAKEEGYTEPDPRLDLSGEDVMRKILILARESGHQLDMEDVAGRSFVPKPCMNESSVEAFLKSVEQEEAHFKAIYDKAASNGKKLRYVASFEDGNAEAGLQEVGEDHPFWHLAGKDNIVLFYTDRYAEQPLVVKGAGAGADVTASGIFADIMKVANAHG
ncbi:MAG: bifunctional aspartate kinase/homoserine dehydrogenase I [Cyclobacteriaceae bacterium]